jgi:ABC-type Fe3+ transport system substrate-binding protein
MIKTAPFSIRSLLPLLTGLALAAPSGATDARALSPREPVSLAWYTSLPISVAADFSRANPSILVKPVSAEDMFMRWREKRQLWNDADVVTDLGIELQPGITESGRLARMEPPSARGAGCSWTRAGSGYYAYTHAVRFPLMFRTEVSGPDAADSLAALAEPRWKGKVLLPDPESSAEAACLYRFVARKPGLGLEWLKRMRRNQAVVVMFPSSLVTILSRGYDRAGWGWPFMKLVDDDDKLWSRPAREGSPLLLYASGVSAASRHAPEAGLFVRWLLDPATQRRMAEKGAFYALAGADCARLDRESMTCLRGWAGADPAEIGALLEQASAALLGD